MKCKHKPKNDMDSGSVTIFHYLAVAVAELNYFETRGFLLLRHNALRFANLFLCVTPSGPI